MNVLLKLLSSIGVVINPATEDTLATRATEATAGAIKAKTDNLDLAISALRDALRGASSKTLTDLAAALATLDTSVGGLKGGSSKTLSDIWNSLQQQRGLATTLWTDNSGANYVRRDIVDESAGTITIVFTDASGNPATPGAGLRALGSTDKELAERYFVATGGGTGYVAGDFLGRVIVIDTSVNPPTIASQTWLNLTAGTIIAAPTPGSYEESTEIIGLKNVAGGQVNPATEDTIASFDQRFYRLMNDKIPNGYEKRTALNLSTYAPAGEVAIAGVDAASKYFAMAPKGTATNAAAWDVVRIQEDANGSPVRWWTAAGVRFDLAIQADTSVWS